MFTGLRAICMEPTVEVRIKSGAIAITGVTTSDTGNPSSYADVCNAVAGTDDSLAIGASAKVELYEGAAPMAVVTRVDRLHLPGAMDELGTPVTLITTDGVTTATGGKEYFVVVDPTDSNADRFYENKEAFDDDPEGGVTLATLIDSLLADEDIKGTATPGNYALSRISNSVGETRLLLPVPAARAVAIGADSSVTGDNGVALGADATAGENGIAIGAGVTAGANEVIIGSTATTRAVIGGIDLGQLVTNTDAADGRITAEETARTEADTALGVRITDEATARTGADTALDGRIKTNVADITRNRADIDTNRSGIAMAIAFAHLPSVPAGDQGSWGIGAGSFAGKSALAVGISYRVQKNGLIKAGVSSSGGETSFGIGFGKGF